MQKDESQNGNDKKTKYAKFSKTQTFFTPCYAKCKKAKAYQSFSFLFDVKASLNRLLFYHWR